MAVWLDAPNCKPEDPRTFKILKVNIMEQPTGQSMSSQTDLLRTTLTRTIILY